jgi:hypothetical protein
MLLGPRVLDATVSTILDCWVVCESLSYFFLRSVPRTFASPRWRKRRIFRFNLAPNTERDEEGIKATELYQPLAMPTGTAIPMVDDSDCQSAIQVVAKAVSVDSEAIVLSVNDEAPSRDSLLEIQPYLA